MSAFLINPYSFKAPLLPQEATETLSGSVAISNLIYEDVPFTNQTETLSGSVAISDLIYEDVPFTNQTETLSGSVALSNFVYSEPDGAYWYNAEWFNESRGYELGTLGFVDNWFPSDPYNGDTMAGDGAAIVEVAGYTNPISGSKSISFVDFPQNDLVSFYGQDVTNPDPFFDGVKVDLFFAMFDNEQGFGDPDEFEFELVGAEGAYGIIKLLFTPVSGQYRIDRQINEITTEGPVLFNVGSLFKLSIHLKPNNKADVTLQACDSSGTVSGTLFNVFTNSDITSTTTSDSLNAINIFTLLFANGASSPGPIKLLVNNLTVRTRLT
jgi:hypothetical protein